MKDNLHKGFSRLQRAFGAFTTGQKVVAALGVAALLLAGVMVFRWAATPNYSPLFSNLAAEDASAVIDELEATGVPYEITNNGATVMVPREQVYETRIALSGEGLPTSSDGGYSLLDEQSLSTSQFQEQTSFKRAMEGELASTVEAIDGVQTAVVHLALPAKEVFAKEQDPATASVLVDTEPGSTFTPEQVQAVVHLVASSIDGLDPDKVTVADASGQVLSGDDESAAGAGGRSQAVADYEEDLREKIQQTLDRVVGPGNSTVAVTANLDFDKAVTETRTFESDPDQDPLSQTTQTETYQGAGGAGTGATGVVGPDGQMDDFGGPGGGDSTYRKRSTTEDNAVNTTVERRENAPGAVESLHVGVVLASELPVQVDAGEVREVIAAAVGEDVRRGDTIRVSSMPFDTSAAEAAEAELAAAAEADARAARMELFRNIGLGVLIALLVLLAWLKSRKRAKERAEATTYVVEQLRMDAAARTQAAAPVEPSPAMMALESSEANQVDTMRDELTALVERQPEDVAALLRGWLVERP